MELEHESAKAHQQILGAEQADGGIIISLDDLAAPSIQQRVEDLQNAAKPQLIRTVGSNAERKLARNPIFRNSSYGLIGALAGALLLEVIAQADSASPWYGNNAYVGTIIYFGGVALILGMGFTLGESIETRSGAKVFREIGLGSAIMVLPIVIAAAIAEFLYSHLWMNYLYGQFQSGGYPAVFAVQGSIRHHVIRGLAWGICALAMGVGLGAAKKSLRAVMNGLAAGLIGGFIGGFIFDYFNFKSGIVNRVIADTIIGLLIGLSLGLISELTKQHWVEIVTGGMAGKQFIVFASTTRVGSAPSADITLIKDAAIAPLHFELRASGKTLAISPTAPQPTMVNGISIGARQVLNDGDLVALGETILRYRSKHEAMPTLS